jgi:hypothetical protein
VADLADNVRAELQFLARHPGAKIMRHSADVAAGLTIRYTARLSEADGGAQAEAADLGELLGRLRQLAGEDQAADQ